jgi:very-short-patch-repair endonuclease
VNCCEDWLFPRPWGEGGPRPALSPAGAGRVRGHLDRSCEPFSSFSNCGYTRRMRIPTQRVRALRRNQTEAETAAWRLLRDRRLGPKFRRQFPIEDRVVDFYCFEHRLPIELDGGVHSQPSQIQRDRIKDDHLRAQGIRLLRVPNGLVLRNPEAFVARVREAIQLAVIMPSG